MSKAMEWALAEAHHAIEEHTRAIQICEDAMQTQHAKYLERGEFFKRLEAERDEHVAKIAELHEHITSFVAFRNQLSQLSEMPGAVEHKSINAGHRTEAVDAISINVPVPHPRDQVVSEDKPMPASVGRRVIEAIKEDARNRS